MSTLRSIAVVDTETTSLANPWVSHGRRPKEIAVITRDGGEVREIAWRLRLSRVELDRADPESVRIWGPERPTRWPERNVAISDRPSLATYLRKLLAGRVLVGVNPAFDGDTLAAFIKPHAPQWHHHTIDVTVLGAYATGLPLDSWSEDVSTALGVDRADYAPAHSALADARWALAQLEAIERLGGVS